MAEYIEREAAISTIWKTSAEHDVFFPAIMLDAIKSIPAANVRENVPARWECIHEKGGYLICNCSNCGIEQDYEPGASFCKYCGADMRGGDDELR